MSYKHIFIMNSWLTFIFYPGSSIWIILKDFSDLNRHWCISCSVNNSMIFIKECFWIWLNLKRYFFNSVPCSKKCIILVNLNFLNQPYSSIILRIILRINMYKVLWKIRIHEKMCWAHMWLHWLLLSHGISSFICSFLSLLCIFQQC